MPVSTKGEARITLVPGVDGTELQYVAEMKIGGKLATVGDRLFGAAVKRNITDFFSGLETCLRNPPGRDAEVAAQAPPAS